METLVSIIVPVYKVEKYLRQCLDSLVSQTYSNIEIILVDDGSPDNCGIICDEYAEKDSRIIVIHKKNEGLSAARNNGIDIAKGEYLMFVDSDDWVEPTYCERALEQAILQNAACVAFGFCTFRTNGEIISMAPLSSRFISAEEAIACMVERKFPYSYVWNKIYKRSLFKDLRFPLGVIYEDNAILYLVFHLAKGVYVFNDRLYNYRRREGSLSIDKLYSEQMVRDRFEVLICRLSFIEKNYPSVSNRQFLMIAMDVARGLCFLKTDKETKMKMELFLRHNKEKLKNNNNLDKNTRLLLWMYYSGGLMKWLYFSMMPHFIGKNKAAYRI